MAKKRKKKAVKGRTYETCGKSFATRKAADRYARNIANATGTRVPIYETTGAAEARAGLIPESDSNTKEKQAAFAKYLNGGDQACPHCGGNIEGGSIVIEGAEAVQRVSCTDCGEAWQDIYKLAAVCTTDGQTIASKAIPVEAV